MLSFLAPILPVFEILFRLINLNLQASVIRGKTINSGIVLIIVIQSFMELVLET
jgi:hypothetical protein